MVIITINHYQQHPRGVLVSIMVGRDFADYILRDFKTEEKAHTSPTLDTFITNGALHLFLWVVINYHCCW